MTSNDIRVIVNDEQSFRIYVVEQFGKMDARMSRIETRLDGVESRVGKLESDMQELHAEMRAVQDEQRLMRQSIDSLQTSVYWVLGAIGIFLAALGVFLPVYLSLKDPRKEKHETSPAPTVITIPQPQVDINAIARQLGEMFNLEPKN